jgi:hypothetical protein
MPSWVDTIRTHYSSDASRQFILFGNTEDVFPLTVAGKRMGPARTQLVTLSDYVQSELLSGFEVLISYGAATGIQVCAARTSPASGPTSRASAALPPIARRSKA